MTPYLLKSYVPFKSNSQGSAIVEYLDYQIPDSKGNGDMQAAKQLKCATYRRYTDVSVMGVRVG